MIYERNDCRLCGGALKTRLSLKPTPVANSFPEVAYSGELHPLDLKECVSCQHVQIGHVVSDSELYGVTYKYETPFAQFPSLLEQAVELRRKCPDVKTVLEIGANNGLNVSALRKAGFAARGIDPSFCSEFVDKATFSGDVNIADGSIDLIVANNVLAHVDDLRDVFSGIDRVLSPHGALVFEVQYFLDMAENGLFDMIYHEHRDYHMLTPLVGFMAKYGISIKEVERIPAHGGSIRVHCGRGEGIPIAEKTIDWHGFSNRIAMAKESCLARIDAASSQVIAFGATAKACTLIHQFGIQERIAYCVDCTPQKQGRYIAGTAIKVQEEAVLERSKSAKTLLLTAWNYESIIRAKYPDMDFIVPFQKSHFLTGAYQ